jgi:hypothetical protein
MRELIPTTISQLSVQELTNMLRDKGGFYSHALCSELKKNKVLHLLVMHPDDISKLNFLMGDSRQYFLDLDLDVIEMRALRTCLPDTFDLDKDGRKAEWRAGFISKLKQLVSRDNGDLVKGGWDAGAGKRVMVRLPALQVTVLSLFLSLVCLSISVSCLSICLPLLCLSVCLSLVFCFRGVSFSIIRLFFVVLPGCRTKKTCLFL